MKKDPEVMNQHSHIRIPDWYLGKQEDDFLLGKAPFDLQEIWEDEE